MTHRRSVRRARRIIRQADRQIAAIKADLENICQALEAIHTRQQLPPPDPATRVSAK